MYQWRKFEFFEEKNSGVGKKANKIAEEEEEEKVIECCSSGRGKLVIGYNDGTISLLDRGLNFNFSFHAHSSSVLFLQQLKVSFFAFSCFNSLLDFKFISLIFSNGTFL